MVDYVVIMMRVVIKEIEGGPLALKGKGINIVVVGIEIEDMDRKY